MQATSVGCPWLSDGRLTVGSPHATYLHVVLPTPPLPPTNIHFRDFCSMMFFSVGSKGSTSGASSNSSSTDAAIFCVYTPALRRQRWRNCASARRVTSWQSRGRGFSLEQGRNQTTLPVLCVAKLFSSWWWSGERWIAMPLQLLLVFLFEQFYSITH